MKRKSRMYIRGSEMTRDARLVGGELLPAIKPVDRPFLMRTGYRPSVRWAASVVVFFACLTWTSTCLANPSQDEVFKSISNNVDSHSDNGMLLAVLATIAGVVLIAAVMKNRSSGPERGTAPLNHPGKLARELMKVTGLKAGQLRQLRVLADDLETRGMRVESPLTLLLCPSLLRTAKEAGGGVKSEIRNHKFE